MKNEIFKNELNYIDDNVLRKFIIYCLENAPDYFYTVPASSSGKYHPTQDLGEGGLIRHTKAVVQVAMDLIRTEQFKIKGIDKKDDITSACILHDIIKNGFTDSGKTVTEHPLLASEFIEQMYLQWDYKEKSSIWTNKNYIQYLIKSHMGIWNKDKEGNEILPLVGEYNPFGKLVHLADYIASRKYIDMNQIGLFDK